MSISSVLIEKGAHFKDLSILSIAGMPYALKFLVAPIMDAVREHLNISNDKNFLLVLFQEIRTKKDLYCSFAIYGKESKRIIILLIFYR